MSHRVYKPWNRCDICGRFFSLADCEAGLIEQEFWNSWNYFAETVDENYYQYHKACK